MSTVMTINLEADMPTVDQARRRLVGELHQSRIAGVKVVKLIHGYGSTGVGGALRQGIRKSLALRRKEGLVADVVFGEKWDIFDATTQKVLAALPELRRDRDLQQGNPGITIVLLNPLPTGR